MSRSVTPEADCSPVRTACRTLDKCSIHARESVIFSTTIEQAENSCRTTLRATTAKKTGVATLAAYSGAKRAVSKRRHSVDTFIAISWTSKARCASRGFFIIFAFGLPGAVTRSSSNEHKIAHLAGVGHTHSALAFSMVRGLNRN